MISVQNLCVEFSARPLFTDVSYVINKTDRIALVGKNGAGKSTMLKIIAGEQNPTSGSVAMSEDMVIGYLPQQMKVADDTTVISEVKKVFNKELQLHQEIEKVSGLLSEREDYESAEYVSLIERLDYLNERLQMESSDNMDAEIERTLTGLGFLREDFDRPTSEFSGGWRMRIELAKILLSRPDVLLLDEPTNHLDIESVEWLEGFLQGYKGAFIVISHDRYFLDKVTNKTFEMEAGRFRSFNGNYTAFAAQREIDKKTEDRNYENTVREIERLEGIVEQQRRWNRERNIKTAESKLKVIEKLEKDLVKPQNDDEEIRFSFKAIQGGGNDVVMTEGLGMRFGDKRLFSNADMLITKGEKVFLLGPNGCGKTTFLKIIMGMYEPTEGEYKIGANIHTGYYDQIQENLSMDKTIFDEIYDEYPTLTQTEIRNALAVFLFRGEDVFKEIKKLSGGERARVELVKLMLKKTNLLIMDEPTNHLDIESREALESALSDYDGTILMVSHDRYFINKTADRILYLSPDGIKSFNGGYDDYVKAIESRVDEPEKKVSSGAIDYKEQKRLEAKKRKVANDFKKTEEKITETEDKITELGESLNDPSIATDYEKISEISQSIDSLNAELEALYEEWERLQIEMEEMEE